MNSRGLTDEEYKDLDIEYALLDYETFSISDIADITGPRLQGYSTESYDKVDYDFADIFDLSAGKKFRVSGSFAATFKFEPGFKITNVFCEGVESSDYETSDEYTLIFRNRPFDTVLDTFTTFAGFNVLNEDGTVNEQLVKNILKYRLLQSMAVKACSHDPGSYAVPFHHGSQVKVNDIVKTIGKDYIVGRHRKSIKFIGGSIPSKDDKIEINLFFSDRFFIAINGDWKEYYIVPHNHTYATVGTQNLGDFDSMDAGLDESDHLMWTFFDINQPYYRDMLIEGGFDLSSFDEGGYSATTNKPVDAQFVNLPWKRDTEYVTIKQLYHGKSSGEIIKVSIPSLGIENAMMPIVTVSESEIVIKVIDAGPKSGEDANYEYIHIYNLSEDTQTIFEPFGCIKKLFDENGDGYYVFEWHTIPDADLSFEFRIEQHDQYNNWSVAKFKEDVKFVELLKFADVCLVNSMDEIPESKGYDTENYDEFMFGGIITDSYGRKYDEMIALITETDPTNIGNGRVSKVRFSNYSAFESIDLVATSSNKFKVIGSISGEFIDRIEVGTETTIGAITFVINKGTTNFKAGDTFRIRNYLFIDMSHQSNMIRQKLPINRLVIRHSKHGMPLCDVFEYDTNTQIEPDSIDINEDVISIYFDKAIPVDVIVSSEASYNMPKEDITPK